MNNKNSTVLKAALICLFGMGASMHALPAQAAWHVTDAEVQRLLGQIKEHTQSLQKYYETHGQQAGPVTGAFSSVDWPTGQPLHEVAEDYGVSVSCGGGGALTAATIRSSLSRGFILPEKADVDAIKKMQEEICGARMLLTNVQYNESVKLVNQTLPAIKAKYEQDVLAAVGERGFANAGADQVTLMAAQLEFDMAVVEFRERQAQYERYQGLLSNYGNYLGRRAMAGRGRDEGGLVSDLISAAVGGSVIQAALKIGN